MDPKKIPETLWRDAQVIMPPDLASELRAELELHGRFAEACGPNISDKDLVGGEDAEEALRHFIHRFKTSSARTQYVTLSPCGTFDVVSQNLLEFMFDGKISILDVPCGSGGGLFGFLCTVAELRRQKRLPPLPVDLAIFAGDVSGKSREIHESMCEKLSPRLENVGIRVKSEYSHWDVSDPYSTSRLVDRWLSVCPDHEEYLVFVSAFSGYADKNTEIVARAIDLIVSRFYDKICILTWVEPTMKPSRRVLERLTDWIGSWFTSRFSLSSPNAEKEYHFKHPFSDEKIRGHAQVRQFKKEIPQ